MKFYSTILIAFILFGLCLIERKAKERMNGRAGIPEISKGDADKNMNLAKENTPTKRQLISISADTTVQAPTFSPGLFRTMSLNVTIFSNP
jgi:hypothetical protein